MNVLTLLLAALGLLSLTALGSISMTVIRAKSAVIPDWLAMAHGLLALAALALLIFAGVHFGLALAVWVGVCLLVVAGGAGMFVNLRYQAMHLAPPTRLIVAHGAIAALGAGLIATGLA